MGNEFEVEVTVKMTVTAEDTCEAGARVLAVFAEMERTVAVESMVFKAREDVSVRGHRLPHFSSSGFCLCECAACGGSDCYCTFGCKGTSYSHHHEAA